MLVMHGAALQDQKASLVVFDGIAAIRDDGDALGGIAAVVDEHRP